MCGLFWIVRDLGCVKYPDFCASFKIQENNKSCNSSSCLVRQSCKIVVVLLLPCTIKATVCNFRLRSLLALPQYSTILSRVFKPCVNFVPHQKQT